MVIEFLFCYPKQLLLFTRPPSHSGDLTKMTYDLTKMTYCYGLASGNVS